MVKVFWGKPIPPNALLSAYPFFPNAPSPFSGTAQCLSSLPLPKPFLTRSRRFLPEKKQWAAIVEKALSEIRKGRIEKVVLARCTLYECFEKPDPFAVVAMLPSRGATRFCFANEEEAFLGATPELLFSRNHLQIKAAAMAGTRKRGKTPQADQRLERELLSSSKDLREWSYIPRHFQNALAPLCKAPLTFSPLRVHKTENVQHLYSSITATLKSPLTDAALIDRLHPTPALAGTPTTDALSLIQELEPFERGLYSGAIGWSTPESSEWFAAIRSCFIQGTTVHLFTAAGIVEDSDPAAEWEELNSKLQLYEGIFS